MQAAVSGQAQQGYLAVVWAESVRFLDFTMFQTTVVRGVLRQWCVVQRCLSHHTTAQHITYTPTHHPPTHQSTNHCVPSRFC